MRRKITALLLDLEGTVYQAGRLIENAGEAIAALEARGIRVGYATNTTSRPRAVVARELADMDSRSLRRASSRRRSPRERIWSGAASRAAACSPATRSARTSAA